MLKQLPKALLIPGAIFLFFGCDQAREGSNELALLGLLGGDPALVNQSASWYVESNPTPERDVLNAIEIDGDYIYLGGALSPNSSTSQWRIEKRRKTDGSLIWHKNSLVGTGATLITDIALDGDYIYAVGFDSSSGTNWRIEKRSMETGEYDSSFGTGGILARTGNFHPQKVLIDGDYFYVMGYQSASEKYVFIEKRLKSDGSTVNSFHGDGRYSSSARQEGRTICQDATHLYVGGIYHWATIESNHRFFVSKIDKASGNLDTAFDGDGLIVTGIGGAFSLHCLDGYLYAGGYYNDGSTWYAQKINSSNGLLNFAFGDGGSIKGERKTANIRTINSKDNSLYLVGNNSYGLQVEKRNLKGGLLSDFNHTGVFHESRSGLVNDAVIDKDYLYVVGWSYKNPWAGVDEYWYIKRFSL